MMSVNKRKAQIMHGPNGRPADNQGSLVGEQRSKGDKKTPMCTRLVILIKNDALSDMLQKVVICVELCPNIFKLSVMVLCYRFPCHLIYVWV